LGRGVGDVEFLAKCGAEVLVTDKKNGSELAASVEKLKRYPNVRFHLGGHDPEDFKHCDMILKAAGVRLDSPEITAARVAGVEVAMSTALFAKYASAAGVNIVGVTGTRGKSTISHMLHHVLKAVGKRVHLGGNVRGLSTLALLPEVEVGDIAVLELDSWQLQGFGELKMSPHVAIFSNLMPDHQNYYKNMEEYFTDKANIFRFQKEGDTLIVGSTIEARVRHANPPVEPLVPGALPADWTLKVPGEHNRHNAALAAAALLSLGLNSQQIRNGLESFEGVEGRLQLVGDKNDIEIYNDNNATTPEATVAALRALGDGITLIAGGSEKELALDELVREVQSRVSHLIVLVHPDYKGSVRFIGELQKAGVPFDTAETLEEAVKNAAAVASKTILFSPAFASFGMFKNEYERNDQFLSLVARI
jgi:UDP-N-acetylmuramoylalanine--D-glutamate ligase